MPEPLTATLQKLYVPLPPEHVFIYRHAFQVLAQMLARSQATQQESESEDEHELIVTPQVPA